MAESYLQATRSACCRAPPTSNGEYGVKDIYVGVPAVIGAGGVERVVEIELDRPRSARFDKSVDAVQGLVDACKNDRPHARLITLVGTPSRSGTCLLTALSSRGDPRCSRLEPAWRWRFRPRSRSISAATTPDVNDGQGRDDAPDGRPRRPAFPRCRAACWSAGSLTGRRLAGFHVRALGAAIGPFESVVGHYNPPGAELGCLLGERAACRRHRPAVDVPEGGSTTVELLDFLRLDADLLDADGAAVVIRADR